MQGSLGNVVGGALAGGPIGAGVGGMQAMDAKAAKDKEAKVARDLEAMKAQNLLAKKEEVAAAVAKPTPGMNEATRQGALDLGPTPGDLQGPNPVATTPETLKGDPVLLDLEGKYKAAQAAYEKATTPEAKQQALHDLATVKNAAIARAQEIATQNANPAQADMFPDAPVPGPVEVPEAPAQVPAAPPQAGSSPAPSPAAGAPAKGAKPAAAPAETVEQAVARLRKKMIDEALFPGDEGVLDSVAPEIRRDVARALADDTGVLEAQKMLSMDEVSARTKKAKKGAVTLDAEDITALAKIVRQQNNGARGPLKALHKMVAAWDKALGLAAGAKSVAKIGEHTGDRQALAMMLHAEMKALADEIGQKNMDAVIAEIKKQDAAGPNKNTKADGTQKQANIRFAMAWESYKTNGLLSDAITDNAIRFTKEQEKANEGTDEASKLEAILDKKAEDAEKGRVIAGKRQKSWKSKHTGEAVPSKNYFRIIGLLDHLMLHNKNLMTRVMATAVRGAFERIRPDFAIVVEKAQNPEKPNTSGNWNFKTRTLTIYPNGRNERTILHELIHALTVDYILKHHGGDDPHVNRLQKTFAALLKAASAKNIDAFVKSAKLDPSREARLKHIIKILAGLQKNKTPKGEHLQDIALAEFVTYGFTDSVLQDFMKSVKIDSITDKMDQVAPMVGPPSARRVGKQLSLWSRFVEQMSQLLFGKSWAIVHGSLMAQFLSDGAQLMHAATSEQTVERVAEPVAKKQTAEDYWNSTFPDGPAFKDLTVADRKLATREYNTAVKSGNSPDGVLDVIREEHLKSQAAKAPGAKAEKAKNVAKDKKAKAAKPAPAAPVEVGPAATEWDEEYRAGDEKYPKFADLLPETQTKWKEALDAGAANSSEFERLVRLDKKNRIAAKTRTKEDVESVETRTVDDWFAPAEVDAMRSPAWKSRERLTSIPIDAFLKLASPIEGDDSDKIARVKKVIDSGGQFSSLPFLITGTDNNGDQEVLGDGEGHEGRHRAMALRDLGYTHIPVVLKSDIRWSEQNDPKKLDYHEQWPANLVGYNGYSIPFPVAREQAEASYGEKESLDEEVSPEIVAKYPEYAAAKQARDAKTKEEADRRAEAAAQAATSARERTEAKRLDHLAKESVFAGTKPRFKGPLGWLDMAYEALFKATGLPTLTKATWATLEKGNAWVADSVPMYRSFLHNVVSGYGLTQPYLAARHTLQQGQVHKIKAATTFFSVFQDMTPDQQLAVTDALLNPDKEAALRANLTDAQKTAIDYAKKILKDLIDDGIKAGTLPTDLADMEAGAVLKAVFIKDVGEEGKTGLKRSSGIMGTRLKDIGKVVSTSFANVVNSPTGRYHEAVEYRKDGTTSVHFIPVEGGSAKLAELRAAGKDIEVDTDNVWRMSKEKTNNETATFFRPFTSDEMVSGEMVSDPRYLLHSTVHHMMQDIMHAEMFNFLADYGNVDREGDGPEGALVFPSKEAAIEHQKKYADKGVRPQNWVQVPNTKNAAGKLKYGALADQWVSQSIWNDINSQVSNAPVFPGFDKWLTRWKLAKTAFSPVTHFNNVMSNFALAFYRDVPAGNIIEAAKIYWNAEHGTSEEKAAAQKIIEEFDDSGANIGSYGQSEIRRGQMLSVLEELAKTGATETKGLGEHAALMKVMEMIEYAKATKVGKAGAYAAKGVSGAASIGKQLYEMEDNIFRLASYMTHIQNGESVGQAGLRASQDFVDYNITAPWINKLRGSFFPFIAWPYRMIPAMIGIAVEKPWKFASMVTALYGLNALGFAIAGGDEEEERKYMPEYQKGRLGGVLPVPKMLRLPFTNTYFDISAAMPLGDLASMDPAGFFGAPWLRQFMPGGPLVILAESLFGYDSFRGEKMTKETNTPSENFGVVMKHLAQQSLPNIPYPGSRHFGTLLDVLRDKHGITGAETNGTLKVLSIFGPKIYANDLKEEKAVQGIVISKLWREYSTEMRAIANREYRFGDPDKAKVQADIKALNDRFLAKMKDIQSP